MWSVMRTCCQREHMSQACLELITFIFCFWCIWTNYPRNDDLFQDTASTLFIIHQSLKEITFKNLVESLTQFLMKRFATRNTTTQRSSLLLYRFVPLTPKLMVSDNNNKTCDVNILGHISAVSHCKRYSLISYFLAFD